MAPQVKSRVLLPQQLPAADFGLGQVFPGALMRRETGFRPGQRLAGHFELFALVLHAFFITGHDALSFQVEDPQQQ